MFVLWRYQGSRPIGRASLRSTSPPLQQKGVPFIPFFHSQPALAQQFDIHPSQITQWKAQLLDGAAGVFGSETRGDSQGPAVDLTVLHAKIGELTLENDFLAGALNRVQFETRRF